MMMMMMASTRLLLQHFPLINMAIFMIINYKVFTANFADSLLRYKLFPPSHRIKEITQQLTVRRRIDKQTDRQLNGQAVERLEL